MNQNATQTLLDEIGDVMRRQRRDGWRTITLTVTAAGNMLTSKLSVELTGGGHDKSQELDDAGDDVLNQLRDAMYNDNEGTWYNATFVVSGTGAPESSFDFDNPPYGGLIDHPDNPGRAAPALLLLDQEMYPCDEAHLPAWHPARRSQ